MEIVDYTEEFKDSIKALNIEWLSKYFVVEAIDEIQLSNPKTEILDKGGFIYYAIKNFQVIGTVTLMKIDSKNYELGKMAVTENQQGLGIGKKLLIHCIEKAKELQFENLILYSNTKLVSAIKLYEAFGFIEKPMDKPHYKRANIKMELRII